MAQKIEPPLPTILATVAAGGNLKSSEFIGVIITILGSLAGSAAGWFPSPWGECVAGAAAIVYALLRTWHKNKVAASTPTTTG